jgi:hypothetical protein
LIKKKKTSTPLALDRHNRITVLPWWLWHKLYINFRNAKIFKFYFLAKKTLLVKENVESSENFQNIPFPKWNLQN